MGEKTAGENCKACFASCENGNDKEDKDPAGTDNNGSEDDKPTGTDTEDGSEGSDKNDCQAVCKSVCQGQSASNVCKACFEDCEQQNDKEPTGTDNDKDDGQEGSDDNDAAGTDSDDKEPTGTDDDKEDGQDGTDDKDDENVAAEGTDADGTNGSENTFDYTEEFC